MPPRLRRPPRAGALGELSPSRILKQIVLLQTAWYTVAMILIMFTTLVAGKRFGIDLLFDWECLRGDTAGGWTLGLCWLLDSLAGVIFLLILVSRSKLVPDFALTIHLIHLIVTSLYTHSLPSNYLWWALQVASSAVMIFLGVWTCQVRELQPMSFGGGVGKAKATPALPPSSENGGEETGGKKEFSIGCLGEAEAELVVLQNMKWWG